MGSAYKNVMTNVFTFVILFAFYSVWGQKPENQDIFVDQEKLYYAIIKDPLLIKMFSHDFHIIDNEISKLKIIDLTSNGFGNGDLILTLPGNEVYYIDQATERVRKEMNGWKFQANCTFVYEHRITPEMMERRRDRRAEHSILAALLRGLNKNYKDIPIKLWLERDSTYSDFEIWGYNIDKMKVFASSKKNSWADHRKNIIDPLITWIKKHPEEQPYTIRQLLESERSDLTSAVEFNIRDRSFSIFLRCSEETRELAICILEGNDAIKLIDQGGVKETHHLEVAILTRNEETGEIIGAYSKRTSPTAEQTTEFMNIFLSWWNEGNPVE